MLSYAGDSDGLSDPETMERAQNNVSLLKQKTDNPSQTIALPDLTDTLRELNSIIEQINAKIKEHNAVLDDRSKKQQDCIEQVWHLIAFMCKSEIAVHKSEKGRHGEHIISQPLSRFVPDSRQPFKLLHQPGQWQNTVRSH